MENRESIEELYSRFLSHERLPTIEVFVQPLAATWMLILLMGLTETGTASISWDMEDWGREPGNIATVTIGGYTVTGELHEAVLRAYMANHSGVI